MLSVNNIEVKYNDIILVLKGISIQVPDGAIVALLGANGGGKTTTLKAISGLLATELGKVTSGSIQWNEKAIENRNPELISSKGIIQVMEGRMVFEKLTVEENLLVGAATQRKRSQIFHDLEVVYEYFNRLRDLSNLVSGYLSGGEQQMLVVGRAMMARPRLMLLDEASLGLSPILVKEIFSIIDKFNKESGTSVLLVEQNVRIALEVADYGYIMENGRIMLDGNTDKLKNNEDIKEFYMGLSQTGLRKSYREVKHYSRRKRWLG